MDREAQAPWALYEMPQGLCPSPPSEHSGGFSRSAHPPAPSSFQEHHSPTPITGEVIGSFSHAGDGTGCGQTITVSTSFHPRSYAQESDLVLYSTDRILFYIHTDYLNRASQAALPAFLSYSPSGAKDAVVPVPETGRILNIILHAVYGTTVTQNNPTTHELLEALDKLPKYGHICRRCTSRYL